MSDIEYEKYRLLQRMTVALEVLAGIRVVTPTGSPVETIPATNAKPAGTEPAEAKLKVGEYVKLHGSLKDDPIQRDVDTRYGTKSVTTFTLNGSYGDVKVSIWPPLADTVMKHTAGEDITLTNMQVKEPYEGVQQASSCKNTKIEA